MSRTDPRKEGLARLARELLSPEWPSADLLVRYVDDPDSLTPEERRAFMAALENSPELQAQVRIMQTTHVSDLLDRVDAAAGAAGRVRGRSPSRRPRRWQMLPAALFGAAAAAAVMLFVAPTDLFEPETTPVRSARPEATPPDEEVAPEPVTRTPVEPDDSVQYQAPVGASARPRLESVVHLGGGRELRGVAIVPEHVGRTRLAAPSVFWHLSGFVPDQGEFLLRIARADAAEPLIEIALRERPQAGLQETRLVALGIELPVAMTYRWSVMYVASAASPAHPVAEGWIQRYPAAATSESDLDLARVRDAADAGFWYDAFGAAHPPGGVLVLARRGLLADIGLERLLGPRAER